MERVMDAEGSGLSCGEEDGKVAIECTVRVDDPSAKRYDS